jgi:hypothetical protein
VVEVEQKHVQLTVASVVRDNRTLLVGSKCGALLAFGIPFNDDEFISFSCTMHSAAMKQVLLIIYISFKSNIIQE